MKYKYNNQWEDLNVKVSDTYPIGAIAPYGGSTAPTNWLICDGSAVSRTTYADLFSVIGTSFGSGNGSTTFNLPDLRSRVPLGKDSRDTDFDTIGETYGEKNHTLTVNEMPSHTHDMKDTTYNENLNKLGIRQDGGTGNHYVPTYTQMDSFSEYGVVHTGGDQAHNTVQPSLVTNYIIKAFQNAGVAATVAQTKTTSDTDTYSCNYVNSFESNIMPVDVTNQINFINCTLDAGKVIKMGKIVFILVSITPTITSTWGNLVSNLPDSLAPINITSDGCPISNSDFWVYGGTQKTIRGTITSGEPILIKGFWILSA